MSHGRSKNEHYGHRWLSNFSPKQLSHDYHRY